MNKSAIYCGTIEGKSYMLCAGWGTKFTVGNYYRIVQGDESYYFKIMAILDEAFSHSVFHICWGHDHEPNMKGLAHWDMVKSVSTLKGLLMVGI